MRACASSARPRLRSALSAGRTLSACSACTFKRCLVSRHWLRTRRLKMSVSSRGRGIGSGGRVLVPLDGPESFIVFVVFKLYFVELQITRGTLQTENKGPCGNSFPCIDMPETEKCACTTRRSQPHGMLPPCSLRHAHASSPCRSPNAV